MTPDERASVLLAEALRPRLARVAAIAAARAPLSEDALRALLEVELEAATYEAQAAALARLDDGD